jgi:hypothetical protein
MELNLTLESPPQPLAFTSILKTILGGYLIALLARPDHGWQREKAKTYTTFNRKAEEAEMYRRHKNIERT